MERAEFVEYIKQLGVPYQVCEIPEKGIDQIWIYSRSEYEKTQKHPRKYKDLFVPYIRVSHFDEPTWYVRDCGWCEYMPISVILDKVNELNES